MITPSGTIQIYSIEGGGLDENGNPVKPTEVLGEPIKVNQRRAKYNEGTYENGKFTAASYVILLDMQEFEPCRFRLSDSEGNVLGDYDVQSKGIEICNHVNIIRLTV